MKRLYIVLACGLVALGGIHMVATLRYRELNLPALWFFYAGVTIVLSGVLNLLNRSYGDIARGLRLVCIVNNLALMALSIIGGILSRAGPGSFALVLGLVGGVTLLSFMRFASGGRPNPTKDDSR